MTTDKREKAEARQVAAYFDIAYTHALRLIRKQVYVVRGEHVDEGVNWNREDAVERPRER